MVALGGEFVDGGPQGLRFSGALGRELLGSGGGQQHPGLLQQARRRAGVAAVQLGHARAHRQQGQQPTQTQQRQARPEQHIHLFALGRCQRGDD